MPFPGLIPLLERGQLTNETKHSADFNCEESQLRLGSKEDGGSEKNRAVFILTAKNANATQARAREHATIPGHAEWPPKWKPYRRPAP